MVQIVVKSAKNGRRSRNARNGALFVRAARYSEDGEFRAAFQLFLRSARNGDSGSQLNVGFCYDTGEGVRRNKTKALFWYKRAYRRGDACAANNTGTIWRDRQNPKRALYWFHRAIKLGNEDSNLEIAKLYLQNGDPSQALTYLERITPSSIVTEATFEEAQHLLKLTRHSLQGSRKDRTIADQK